MSDTTICANCGVAFGRTRSPVTGYVEAVSKFRTRRFCSRVCASAAQRKLWSDEVMAALEALLGDGLSFAECAAALSETMGLGEVTRHHVAGAVHRQRHRRTSAPNAWPGPEEPPVVPESTPDKHPMACRYGDCRLTRQPGRDYCSEHQRILVADRVPRTRASNDSWRTA